MPLGGVMDLIRVEANLTQGPVDLQRECKCQSSLVADHVAAKAEDCKSHVHCKGVCQSSGPRILQLVVVQEQRPNTRVCPELGRQHRHPTGTYTDRSKREP